MKDVDIVELKPAKQEEEMMTFMQKALLTAGCIMTMEVAILLGLEHPSQQANEEREPAPTYVVTEE